jgi:N-acetylglucosaminyl-diphospho-decaprenol L-rhamnosyltransferase
MTATHPGPAREGRSGDIAVVIVSYHTGATLQACLDRALADTAVGEVVVVDNGNPDATLDALRRRAAGSSKLRVLSGHGNIGFAAGCNLGARATSRPILLLLNPDCLIEPGSLDGLLAAVGAPARPWIATVRLVEPSGVEQRGSRRNLGTPWQCLVEALRLDRLLPARWAPRLNLSEQPVPAGMIEVPAISGAFMAMARATFDALGGMDEGYFLHVEDLDFCLRHQRRGGVAYFVPGLACVHVKGTSAAAARFVERHKARGFRRYFHKHFSATHPRVALELAWLVLAAGLLVRGWLSDAVRGKARAAPADRTA